MDLSTGQRTAVFAVIVIVLAALGYFLVVPAVAHGRGRAGAAASPATPAPSAPAPSAPAPTVTTSPAAATAVNIYAWLPFTQQDLAEAAAVTVRFCVDYDTFSYTESAAAYLGRMGGLVTAELAATIEEGYTTMGVATLRTSQKQVSTGTAVIDSLRAFGPASLTFIVTVGQRLVSGGQASTGSTQYAVTVTGSAGRWQVSDIEPAGEGNS